MSDILANLGQQRRQGEQRRHRHVWDQVKLDERHRVSHWLCRCGAIKDEQKARRGKSSRRLGADQERRIEAVYGPTKVGEYGDAIDLLGRDWKWQSKATRADVPVWVEQMAPWQPIAPQAWIETPILAMMSLHRELAPLLIKTWVHVGRRPVDVIIVRSGDWAALHGGPTPPTFYMAMTGAYFLDINGRDERMSTEQRTRAFRDRMEES